MEILAYIIIISKYVFCISSAVLIIFKVFCSIRALIQLSKASCPNKEIKKFVIQTLVCCIIFSVGFIGLQTQISHHSKYVYITLVLVTFLSGFILIFDWDYEKLFQNKSPLNQWINLTGRIMIVSFALGEFPEITLFFLALVILWISGNTVLYVFHKDKQKICKYDEKYYVMRYKWLDGWVWIKPSEITVESKHPDKNSIEQYLCKNIEEAKEVAAHFQKKQKHLKE